MRLLYGEFAARRLILTIFPVNSRLSGKSAIPSTVRSGLRAPPNNHIKSTSCRCTRPTRFLHLSIMVAPEYPETRFPGHYVAAGWAIIEARLLLLASVLCAGTTPRRHQPPAPAPAPRPTRARALEIIIRHWCASLEVDSQGFRLGLSRCALASTSTVHFPARTNCCDASVKGW